MNVDIGPHLDQRDHVSNLLLKQAKEAFKDALIACAVRHGGKLDSWKDHSGTFVFLAEKADGFNNCCLAAMQMLAELPFLKEGLSLSDDLGALLTVRVLCDAGPVVQDPAALHLADEFIAIFKKHGSALSVGNSVTITERVFRGLREPVKSRFQKWKRSAELGVDVYATREPHLRVGPVFTDVPVEPEPTASVESAPVRDEPASARGRLFGAPRSRTLLGGVGVVLCLLIVALVRFWPMSMPPSAPPAGVAPQYSEFFHSEDWRTWRPQIHEKLTAGNVTESTLADALRIKLPARPEHAAAALRRDQAIGEVLMSYPPVAKILWNRFGIDEHNFLGTGLSKPSGDSNNYGMASVHEYLIRNHYADNKGVWMRTLDPVNNGDAMRMTVAELFMNSPDPKKKQVEEITRRVKDKNAALPPPVIRFARFNEVDFSRQLGTKNRRMVFASNLAEVWNLSVMDAAKLSGYISEKGDTFYIWAFLPEHANDVVPATWDQVLNHLPAWLSEIDKN